MQSQKLVFYSLMCVLLLTLAACGGTTTTTTTTGAMIEVRDPWVRPAVVARIRWVNRIMPCNTAWKARTRWITVIMVDMAEGRIAPPI